LVALGTYIPLTQEQDTVVTWLADAT
jgi:hypothetical protein